MIFCTPQKKLLNDLGEKNHGLPACVAGQESGLQKKVAKKIKQRGEKRKYLVEQFIALHVAADRMDSSLFFSFFHQHGISIVLHGSLSLSLSLSFSIG